MPIKRNKVPKNSKNINELRIASMRNSLISCNRKINSLKKLLTENLSEIEKFNLERDLEVEISRKRVLKEQLAPLGFTEKRGRPKKSVIDMYASTHVKFTAMLKTENIDYLKQLKDAGKIDNISSLLDNLIDNHRVKSQFK